MSQLRAFQMWMKWSEGLCLLDFWPSSGNILKQKSFIAFGLLLLGAVSAEAEERKTLGWSLAISNDSMGDWHDRWQSSSIQNGILRGQDWTGSAPSGFGQLMEYRFRTDILTPASLSSPVASDRRHAGVLAFGVHTYAARSGYDLRVGGDLVVVGPQTGMLDFQTELHELLGFTIPDLDNFQIPDQMHIDLSGEVSRVWRLGDVDVRPFGEVQIGSEDLLRVGVDLTLGEWGRGDLMTRANVSGHRVSFGLTETKGLSLVAGADIARVFDSIYLPESFGHELTPVRTRVRGGVHYGGKRVDFFYGLTWLGKEFEAQPEGQFAGTAQIRFRF